MQKTAIESWAYYYEPDVLWVEQEIDGKKVLVGPPTTEWERFPKRKVFLVREEDAMRLLKAGNDAWAAKVTIQVLEMKVQKLERLQKIEKTYFKNKRILKALRKLGVKC